MKKIQISIDNLYSDTHDCIILPHTQQDKTITVQHGYYEHAY